ncbi:hypothetical protein Efla_003408 [Eimeria flavescens]
MQQRNRALLLQQLPMKHKWQRPSDAHLPAAAAAAATRAAAAAAAAEPKDNELRRRRVKRGAYGGEGDFRIWPHVQFQRLNYPMWPPANASPLHPLEPWGRQVFVFKPYAAQMGAELQGPYPRLPPARGPAPPTDSLSPGVSRLAAAAATAAEAAAAAAADATSSSSSSSSSAAYEAAAAAKTAAEAAATAAAAEIAAGPLQESPDPVLCVADHGRRPLLFLSAADLAVLKGHIPRFRALIAEFAQHAVPSEAEKIYHLRRRLLPYKTVGMQRMKKGEHQSHGIKKGVPRERKT